MDDADLVLLRDLLRDQRLLALAPHSAGLGAPWSAVVHVPDAREVDPLRGPRVAVHGHARRIQDPRVLDAIGQAWVARFPSATQTVGLGDFAFVSLDVEGGRLIGGFAAARNLSPSHFQKAAGTA